jgi:tryptophan 7-halogenase
MTDMPIKNVVILGGGSAGWLTAGVLAAEHSGTGSDRLNITLIESPDVPIIGVGEGTWPSMRATLKKIGISETDLFRHCDASFKQGAKFAKWTTGEEKDFYYHPLILPQGFYDVDTVLPWLESNNGKSFADTVSCQSTLCEKGLAPKQITTPEYAAVANYAYHVDATKLGQFLQKHCTENLGVKHILDHVVSVKSKDDGDISGLETKNNGIVNGDMFIDCSGLNSLLLGRHFGIPFEGKKHLLFNDAAIAVQVPYQTANDPIASHTISTAQSSGWIWDIGLPTRRGVGAVYSTAHITDEKAQEELKTYVAGSIGREATESLSYRKISINPGHRKVFWHKNCVAVGMAAGFLEPLEASALVLVESAAGMISNELPATRSVMDIVAKRYNQRFQYYWDTIIDFLKLHYILTKRRDTDYWCDNQAQETIPDHLKERITLWKRQVPNRYDFPLTEEMFPAASWQYVLYGMGFKTELRPVTRRFSNPAIAKKYFDEVQEFTRKCVTNLPTNRELIQKIYEFGLQKI